MVLKYKNGVVRRKMLYDSKFLWFSSIISVIFLSLYCIWPLLFVYLFLLIAIYYDFKPNCDSIQEHALNKVNSAIVKVRLFANQIFHVLINNQFETNYTPRKSLSTMFTNSGWEKGREDRTIGGMSPIPRMTGGITTVVRKHTSTPIGSPIHRGVDLTCNTSIIKPNTRR